MKNDRLVTMLFVMLVITSSSCKKTYTCVCSGGFAGGTTETKIKAVNRQQAHRQCTKDNPPYNKDMADGMYCELK